MLLQRTVSFRFRKSVRKYCFEFSETDRFIAARSVSQDERCPVVGSPSPEIDNKLMVRFQHTDTTHEFCNQESDISRSRNVAIHLRIVVGGIFPFLEEVKEVRGIELVVVR